MLCLVRKDKHKVWTVYLNKPQFIFCGLCLPFSPLFFSISSNCRATLMSVSLCFSGGLTWIARLRLSFEPSSCLPIHKVLYTVADTGLLELTYFVNLISQLWLQEGQWFALIPGVGGQAASARRRAALPMAARKAATLIFPMLGLKTGRETLLYFQYTENMLWTECVGI